MKKNYFLPLVLTLFLSTSFLSFGQWDEMDKIVAPDRQPGEKFGDYNTVSIFGDYAVVGSRNAEISGIQDVGAAYVYKRDNNCNWNFEQKLTATNPINGYTQGDNFGFAVAIHAEFMVISARGNSFDENDQNQITNSGSAYVFQKDVFGNWNQTQKIVSSDREAGGAFGHDVDITRGKIIVGSWGDDAGSGVPFQQNAGAAYIFEYDYSTMIWSTPQKLVASDRDQNDQFGEAVAIYNDYAVVGAPQDEDDLNGQNQMIYAGSAYIFEKINGNWNTGEKIVSTDRWQQESFGRDVDIDGTFVIIGVEGDKDDQFGTTPYNLAGSAFIFERNNAAGDWSTITKIVADDRAIGDRFGHSVAIANGVAVVGAHFESHLGINSDPKPYAGSAYIFNLIGSNWPVLQKIVPNDRSISDNFGSAIAIYEDRIIIGAALEDENDAPTPTITINEAGSAYIFESLFPADQPTITASNVNVCPGDDVTLEINTGNLNDALNWQWYAGSCNSASIGTGPTITVSPSSTTTYYVNGVGGCVNDGLCSSVTINTNLDSWHQTTQNASGGDVTNDVITDAHGNVYVTGTFTEQTTINGGNNPDITINTANNILSSYIAKYNPCGDLLWERHSIESGHNEGRSITFDEQNNTVYMAGNFQHQLRFITSCLPGTPIVSISDASPTGFIAAFDAANGCLKILDKVEHDAHTYCEAITIDENNQTIFVGGHSAPSYVASGSPYVSYVYKYSPSATALGNVEAQIVGDHEMNKVNDMDFDEFFGFLYIIGDYKDKVTFTPGIGTLNVTNLATVTQDAFILIYAIQPFAFTPFTNINGQTNKFMSGEGIAVNPTNGSPYFTGSYYSEINQPFGFSTSSLPYFNELSSYMGGINFNNQGTSSWMRFGNAPDGVADGKSVTVDEEFVYFTGNFKRANLLLQGISPTLSPYVVGNPGGNNHVYIANYDLDGNGVWANVTTDPNTNTAHHTAESITVNNQGFAFVVGNYSNNMDYFNTPGTPQLNSTGFGDNGFILRAESSTGALYMIDNNPQVKPYDGLLSSFNLIAYPNPTTGLAKYTIQDYDSRKEYQISIHDTQGKMIYQSVLTNGSLNIDITDQKNGLYFIQLSDGQSTSYSKIIKVD